MRNNNNNHHNKTDDDTQTKCICSARTNPLESRVLTGGLYMLSLPHSRRLSYSSLPLVASRNPFFLDGLPFSVEANRPRTTSPSIHSLSGHVLHYSCVANGDSWPPPFLLRQFPKEVVEAAAAQALYVWASHFTIVLISSSKCAVARLIHQKRCERGKTRARNSFSS